MSGRKFTLYWSSLELYEKCPQKFLWSKGWGVIDVGAGPGKRMPKPVKRSFHHALMGIVIQAVIERLYNDELWKEPKGLSDRLMKMVSREFTLELNKQFVDWRFSPAQSELLQVCKDGVYGYLKTMKQHKLLGPYARCEIDLVGFVNKYTPVGGRADFIIRTQNNEVLILDGKNSLSKGKYTDPDQLRWYALLFYLAYGRMPDKLGFVYYRYPYGTPIEDSEDMESGVDWVDFSREDLKGLANRAVEALKSIEREKFDPVPSPSNCRFCDYETVCEARLAQKKSRARKPKNVEDLLEGKDGIVELGLKGG